VKYRVAYCWPSGSAVARAQGARDRRNSGRDPLYLLLSHHGGLPAVAVAAAVITAVACGV